MNYRWLVFFSYLLSLVFTNSLYSQDYVSLSRSLPFHFLPGREFFYGDDFLGPVDNPFFKKGILAKIYLRNDIRSKEINELQNIRGQEVFYRSSIPKPETFSELKRMIIQEKIRSGGPREEIKMIEEMSYQDFLKSTTLNSIAKVYLRKIVEIEALKNNIGLIPSDVFTHFAINKIFHNYLAKEVDRNVLSGQILYEIFFKKIKSTKASFQILMRRKELEELAARSDDMEIIRHYPNKMILDFSCINGEDCIPHLDGKIIKDFFKKALIDLLRNIYISNFSRSKPPLEIDETLKEKLVSKNTKNEIIKIVNGIFKEDDIDIIIKAVHGNNEKALRLVVSRLIADYLVAENPEINMMKQFILKNDTLDFITGRFVNDLFYLEYNIFFEMIKAKLTRYHRQAVRQNTFIKLLKKKPGLSYNVLFSVTNKEMDLLFDDLISLNKSILRYQQYQANIIKLDINGENRHAKFNFFKKRVTALFESSSNLSFSDKKKIFLEEFNDNFRGRGNDSESSMSLLKILKVSKSDNEFIHKKIKKQLFNPIFSIQSLLPEITLQDNDDILSVIFLLNIEDLGEKKRSMNEREVQSILMDKIKQKANIFSYREVVFDLFQKYPLKTMINICAHPLWPCLELSSRELVKALFPEYFYKKTDFENDYYSLGDFRSLSKIKLIESKYFFESVFSL